MKLESGSVYAVIWICFGKYSRFFSRRYEIVLRALPLIKLDTKKIAVNLLFLDAYFALTFTSSRLVSFWC